MNCLYLTGLLCSMCVRFMKDFSRIYERCMKAARAPAAFAEYFSTGKVLDSCGEAEKSNQKSDEIVQTGSRGRMRGEIKTRIGGSFQISEICFKF